MNTSFLPNEPILGPDFLPPGNQFTRTAYAQGAPHSKTSRHFTRAERSRQRLGVRNASSAFDPSVGKWRTVWFPSARTRGKNSPSLFPIFAFSVSEFQLFNLFYVSFSFFSPSPPTASKQNASNSPRGNTDSGNPCLNVHEQ